MLGSYDRTNQKHSDPNYHTYRLNLMRRAHGLPKKPKYFFDPLGDDEEYQWLDDWSGPGGKPDIQTNEPMDGNGVNPRNTARARPFPSAGEPSTGEGHEVKDKWAYQKYTKPRRAPGDPTPSPSPPAEVVGIDDKGEKKPRRAQQVEEEEVPMAEDWREYESEEEDGEYEREEEGDEDEEMQSRKSEGSSDFQDPSDQDFGGSDVEVEGGEDEGEYVNDDDKGDGKSIREHVPLYEEKTLTDLQMLPRDARGA